MSRDQFGRPRQIVDAAVVKIHTAQGVLEVGADRYAVAVDGDRYTVYVDGAPIARFFDNQRGVRIVNASEDAL